MSNENNNYDNSQNEPQNDFGNSQNEPQNNFGNSQNEPQNNFGNSQNEPQNNYNFGMPSNASFYGASAEQQTPKKKKKWPIAVGVGSAVAVAAGAGAAYWFYFRTPSFDSPTEAITACLSQLDEQFSTKELGVSALEEKIDTQNLLKAIEEDGMDMNMSLEFKGGSIDELEGLEGLGIELATKSDIKNKAGQLSIGANMMGLGAGIDVYYDEDTLALTSEDLLPDSYIALNKSDLLKKVEAMIDEADKKSLDSFFNQQYTQASAGLQDFTDYCIKQLPDSLVSFAKDWEVKEDTSKPSIKIGKQDYECYTYDVTITEPVFKEFLTDYCDYIAKYDFAGNQYFTLLEQSMPTQDKNISDLIEEALEELPESLDEDSKDKLEMTMYVSKKGKLLGFDIMDKKEGLELRFGGENPGQEIYFDFEADDMSMNYSLINTADGKTDTTEFEMGVSEKKTEIFSFTGVSTYNSKDDTFDLSMDLTGDEDTFGFPLSFTLAADGSYKDIEKGVGYTISYDNMEFELDMDDESYSIELEGEMYYGALTDEVKKPSGTEYDLLKMTEQDADKLLDELRQSALLSSVLSEIKGSDLVTMLDSFWDELADEFSGYSDFDTDDFLDDDDDWTLDDDDDWMTDEDLDEDVLDSQIDINNSDNSASLSSGTYSSMEEYVASDEVQSELNTLIKTLDGSGMKISVKGEGNKLICSYQYESLVKQDGMAQTLESAAETQKNVFIQTATSLKSIVNVKNPIVVIEYIDANGEMIFTKEYAAN